MSIISKKLGNENRVSNSVQRFLQNYKVAYLLRKCGITKIKGISVLTLFSYILGNAFRNGSFYMQKRLGSFGVWRRLFPKHLLSLLSKSLCQLATFHHLIVILYHKHFLATAHVGGA